MRYWKRVFLVVATVVALLAATLPPASGHSSTYCGHGAQVIIERVGGSFRVESVSFAQTYANTPVHEHEYLHESFVNDNLVGSHDGYRRCRRH